jgi:hypothetical protein
MGDYKIDDAEAGVDYDPYAEVEEEKEDKSEKE